ncbi:hypothetical protein FE697_007165 [Mumia zhuanghuii]|uniref:Lipoprotein n=2 Tax=Mumia TaxID=1546255 RepID=A0ABW1QK77_9ACTN|nr:MULTISPECIES: hypothetical protein [Mumia]KAA1423384.1 hypothetical protein FE697_007165 [Mumia zhuanghuii]
MTRPTLLLTALAVLLAVAGCGHSWDWKQADLDRNRLNLGLFRGADTGEKLGTWVRQGEVVATAGATGSDEIAVVVRYERQVDEPFGTPTVETACYRFTPDEDGSNVDFGRTDCP